MVVTVLKTIPQLETEFMTELGLCITGWAYIEEELFHICHHVLGVTQERASIVYYRTPTIDARLHLVGELVATFFPRPPKKDGGHKHKSVKLWEGLEKDLRERLQTRNQLAHSPATPVAQFHKGPEVSIPIEVHYESYVSGPERLRGRSHNKAALRILDLRTHRRDVGYLHMRLRDFRHGEMLKRRRGGQPRKSPRKPQEKG